MPGPFNFLINNVDASESWTGPKVDSTLIQSYPMDVIHHLWNHPPQMMVGNKISIIWIRLCSLPLLPPPPPPANKCKASSLCCNTTPIVIVTNSNAMIITISIAKITVIWSHSPNFTGKWQYCRLPKKWAKEWLEIEIVAACNHQIWLW